MCLGPPVCADCKVLYEFTDSDWNCPICNAQLEDCKTHFHELSSEDRELYQDNSSEVRARKKRERRKCS